MARSVRVTPSEYVSQRELARLVEKMNRAKSDLRELVKLWRWRQRNCLTMDPEAWSVCADELERYLDHGEK